MRAKSELVEQLFPKQFNCTQTVFSLHADEFGLARETVLKIGSGFGGGMACAETCGAVTGSYMVIGMRHGNTTSNPEAKALIKQKIRLFNEKFKAVHKSLICKELTGYDISNPKELAAANNLGVFFEKCPAFIKTACEILGQELN